MRFPVVNGFPIRLILFSLAFFLCTGNAGATEYYGTYSGTTIDFLNVNETTNTAGDPDNLYGAPVLFQNQLLFFPTSYSSYSADGTADTTSGTLQMQISAQAGYFIETVKISELGDFSMTGSGTMDGTQAHISGLLTVTALSGIGGIYTDFESDHFDVSPQSGEFGLSWEIDFTGMDVTLAMISFNNTLQTSSESGTTAFIQKKVIDGPAIALAVNQDPVPLPATWLFWITGLLGMPLIRKIKR